MTRPWWQPCTEEHYERKSYFPFDFFGRFPFGWMDNWYEHWGWIKREHPVKPIRDRPSYVVNTLTDSQEEMRELKGGQIVFDERRQKWYRVRKTVVPSNLSTGPVGLGDPDDKFLRRIEKNVLIPDMMAKRIEKVECRPEFMEYCRCMLDIGEYMGNPRCKPLLKKFQKCKIAMFRDADFWAKMKAEYLEGRAEMRRTGLTGRQREGSYEVHWLEDERVGEETGGEGEEEKASSAGPRMTKAMIVFNFDTQIGSESVDKAVNSDYVKFISIASWPAKQYL